jgi:hypothetical protein
MVDALTALRDVSQKFDQSVLRTTAAARGLSEPSSNAPDLPSSIVDLALSEKAYKAVIAAVGVSKEMDSAALDIIA